MAVTASETTWLIWLLQELGVSQLQPMGFFFYCDSLSVIYIGKNPIFHEFTKHIAKHCHFIREKVLVGLIELHHVPTSE